MSEKTKANTFGEDEYGRKLDRCFTDTMIKAGGGLVLGGVLSLMFFKRRSWPVIMGTGFGIGMGYTNCEKALNK